MPLLFQRTVGLENRPIPISGIRDLLTSALNRARLTDATGKPLDFAPHDYRRILSAFLSCRGWTGAARREGRPLPALNAARQGPQRSPGSRAAAGRRVAIAQQPLRLEWRPRILRSACPIATRPPLHTVSAGRSRIFTTDAIMNGMPPHIAQLLLGHKDINTTMGYRTVYPEEAINGPRAFIARRRALRPSEEYRRPTDAEWDEFLGHFQHRRLALGDCGRAYVTSCIHEHVRCPLLRMDLNQRQRLIDIRDNLVAPHRRGRT